MLPSHAKVVVVGGGIMGCGLAYHLAHEGWTDVVLLEKAELTSGSTWHAAGQITHSTSSYTLGKCVDYNIKLYSEILEAETGQSISWHGCGSLRLAYSEDEMDWLRHTTSVGAALGFNMELVGPERIAELHPYYNLDGVLGALHTPDDGHCDPSQPTMAMAAGARQLGVKIIRRCRAMDIKQQDDGLWKVSTEQGDITCEHVVNAGGTYARQMGEWSGLQLPMTTMTHHYLVTDTVPEFMDLEQELPVIRDDAQVSGYIRMEQKSGLIGIYEKENPNTVWEEECPWEAENHLFTADYDRIMPWLENSMERMPIFGELGLKREVHGGISHPPDGNPLIGPAPGVENYWCCCGTQIGIGWGPGLTRELAKWMVHGAADLNMREFDPRRFGDYAKPEWQVEKAKEDYCLRHEIPFPHFNRLAGRPIKPSALYETLKDQGAVFEEVYGHERPRWFAPQGVEAKDIYSFRRSSLHDIIGAEVKAVRERVGIMDVSAFTKVEVSGPDARSFLDGLIPNNMPKREGGAILTHLLNERGRVEAEITIVKFAEGSYYLVCAAFFEQRLLDHLSKHNKGDQIADITVSNRSTSWNALTLQGPNSRAVLAQCTDHSLSNADFPWLTARYITIAGHQVWAVRMSYAGELGWEFHGEASAMADIYAALWAAGQDYDIANYGSFAMNALRMEKAFPGAGELSNEVTLPEANVMRFVNMDKDFVGKAATQAALDAPLKWTSAFLSIEDNGVEDGHGGEAIQIDGQNVGTTASVSFSHTLGAVLAFAYMKPEAAVPGQKVTVILAGQPRQGVILADAPYDATSALPRVDA
jgi:dimethylglycine dehydrogenase